MDFAFFSKKRAWRQGYSNSLADELAPEILPWIANEFEVERKDVNAFIHITLGAIFHALVWWVENDGTDREVFASQLTTYVWSGLLAVGVIERKQG